MITASPAKIHKMLQSMAIFASYASLSESNRQSKKKDQYADMQLYFCGKEGTCQSKVTKMFDGEGEYFQNLWTVDEANPDKRIIRREFIGHVGYVSQDILTKGSLFMSSLLGKKVCQGKYLHNKALHIMKDLKIWNSYWIDLYDTATGKLPSGWTAVNASEQVLDRIWEQECKEEGYHDEDDDQDDGAGVEEGKGKTKGQTNSQRPEDWQPVHWWTFLLFGPFGASEFGTNVHPLLSVGKDMPPTTKKDGRQSIRKAAAEVESKKRINDDKNNRGESQAVKLKRLELETSAMQTEIFRYTQLIATCRDLIKGAKDISELYVAVDDREKISNCQNIISTQLHLMQKYQAELESLKSEKMTSTETENH